ncbi:hypothetical protein P7K49_027766, partial [Saguinus oedipus]
EPGHREKQQPVRPRPRVMARRLHQPLALQSPTEKQTKRGYAEVFRHRKKRRRRRDDSTATPESRIPAKGKAVSIWVTGHQVESRPISPSLPSFRAILELLTVT